MKSSTFPSSCEKTRVIGPRQVSVGVRPNLFLQRQRYDSSNSNFKPKTLKLACVPCARFREVEDVRAKGKTSNPYPKTNPKYDSSGKNPTVSDYVRNFITDNVRDRQLFRSYRRLNGEAIPLRHLDCFGWILRHWSTKNPIGPNDAVADDTEYEFVCDGCNQCGKPHTYMMYANRLALPNFLQKHRCPVCAASKNGSEMCICRSVAYSAELAADWHPENLLPPDRVLRASNETATWLCQKCGLKYVARVASRAVQNSRCRNCVGKRSSLPTLLDSRPHLVDEWIADLNGPIDKVKCGSHRRVFWKCSSCSHRWSTLVFARAIHDNKCPAPVCRRRRAAKRTAAWAAAADSTKKEPTYEVEDLTQQVAALTYKDD